MPGFIESLVGAIGINGVMALVDVGKSAIKGGIQLLVMSGWQQEDINRLFDASYNEIKTMDISLMPDPLRKSDTE